MSAAITGTILETSRLVLREMSLADLDFVAAMLADPEVMRYYPKCYSASSGRSFRIREHNPHQSAERGQAY